MVVVFGTLCLDRIRLVPKLPRKGGYVEVSRTVETLGGEAWNTARALSIWGAEVQLVTNSLGQGTTAQALMRLLAVNPPARLDLPNLEHPAPVCDIYVTPDGERTMFGEGFIQMEDRSDPSLVLFEEGVWFTADSNLGKASRSAATAAKASGMKVYLMDFYNGADEAVPCDVWQSSTDRVGKTGDIQFNVMFLQDRVDKHGYFGILSDAANGFVAGGWGTPVRHYAPFPGARVVDSTGAGDAFRAGMLFGLSNGLEMPECLRLAGAAGNLNCRGLGATEGLPSLDEVQGLIRGNPLVAKSYG